jgi:hypothetical protein
LKAAESIGESPKKAARPANARPCIHLFGSCQFITLTISWYRWLARSASTPICPFKTRCPTRHFRRLEHAAAHSSECRPPREIRTPLVLGGVKYASPESARLLGCGLKSHGYGDSLNLVAATSAGDACPALLEGAFAPETRGVAAVGLSSINMSDKMPSTHTRDEMFKTTLGGFRCVTMQRM